MNDTAKPAAEIAGLSFEAAMAELEDVVRRLESGQVGLEESIGMYQRGSALKTHCEGKLKAAREQVERIVVGAAGEAVGSKPMDGE